MAQRQYGRYYEAVVSVWASYFSRSLSHFRTIGSGRGVASPALTGGNVSGRAGGRRPAACRCAWPTVPGQAALAERHGRRSRATLVLAGGHDAGAPRVFCNVM